MQTISIQGTEYPVKFGLNAVRAFCKKRNIEFHEYQQELSSLDTSQMTIQQMDNLALLIQCGIAEGIRKEKSQLTAPDIEDIIEIFESVEESEKAFSLFTDAQPDVQEKTEGEKN